MSEISVIFSVDQNSVPILAVSDCEFKQSSKKPQASLGVSNHHVRNLGIK